MGVKHTALKNEILCWLWQPEQNCFSWANETFKGWSYDKTRFMKAGLEGSSDILCAVGPIGHLWVIEVKIGRDQLRDKQEDFFKAVAKVGVTHTEARSLDDVKRDHKRIKDWIESLPV